MDTAGLDGSTKIRGVKRRDRLASEGGASVRGRRLDVQPSMSTTLSPRILVLPRSCTVNTLYMDKATDHLRRRGQLSEPSLLRHVSPLGLGSHRPDRRLRLEFRRRATHHQAPHPQSLSGRRSARRSPREAPRSVLWSARDASGLGADGVFEADSRLAVDAGYGLGHGVLTPYGGRSGIRGAARCAPVCAGRWVRTRCSGSKARRQTSDADEADNQLMLQLAVRF